jgi:hypothetical protein
VVLELLLLWSRKELHPAHGNCTCCPDEEEDIAASQNPLAIAVAPHDALHKKSIRIDPIMQIPPEKCFFGGSILCCSQSADDPEVYLAQLGYKLNVKVKLFKHPPIFWAIFLKFGRIMAIENKIIPALYIASKKKSTRLQIPRENPKSTHI